MSSFSTAGIQLVRLTSRKMSLTFTFILMAASHSSQSIFLVSLHEPLPTSISGNVFNMREWMHLYTLQTQRETEGNREKSYHPRTLSPRLTPLYSHKAKCKFSCPGYTGVTTTVDPKRVVQTVTCESSARAVSEEASRTGEYWYACR